MADATLTVIEKYPGSYRIDHPNFGDVAKTVYAKGVITGFHPATPDDPVVAKDVCDVTVEGGEFKEVPIFYRSPQAYLDNWKLNTDPNVHRYGGQTTSSVAWADFWNATGALLDKAGNPIPSLPPDGQPFDKNVIARGVYSFSVGDEVVVMLQKGAPVAVLGFADGIPRRPFDYVQVEMPTQVIDTGADPPIVGNPYTPYILQLSGLDRNTSPSGSNMGYRPQTGDNMGPDGFSLKLLKDARVFSDKVVHPEPGPPLPFELNWDYQCFYGSEEAPRGNIELEGYYWVPNPDPMFGPFNGWMDYGGSVPFTPWATYLAAWKNTCDIVQTLNRATMDPNPWIGAWPFGSGRPNYWLWIVDDPNNSANQGITDYVMRTFLIEAGPLLYLIRVFYQHTMPPSGGGKVWYWKNRIAWASSFPPPSDWSGYSGTDPSKWTPPMWVPGVCPNPTPTKIEECYPPPDGYLPGNNNRESFYSDNPNYVYVAPNSKEILDNIEGIVAASNAEVDVIAAQGSALVTAIPEGFRNYDGPMEDTGSHFLIPPVGNLRELNFKYAARIGA